MNWKKALDKDSIKKVFNKTSKPKESPDEVIMVCQNCETEFKGNFCPHCGQSTKEFNKPFRILIYDFTGTLFAFDTRFFNTLRTIFTKPGKFSNEYMEGKRARYMKPFQFYVFVSFVFFLLLSIQTGRFIDVDRFTSLGIEQDSITNDTLISADDTEWFVIGTTSDSLLPDSTKLEKVTKTSIISAADLAKAKTSLTNQLLEKDITPVEKRFIQNTLYMLNYPDAFLVKLYKYLSWSFFLVMPIFAFWLWLFFHKQRPFYADHFIYSLVAHSTTFLIFSVIITIKLMFPDKIITLENYLYWLIPIYVWLGMKKYYGRSITRTTVNFLILGFIYTFSITITVAGVFVISLYY